MSRKMIIEEFDRCSQCGWAYQDDILSFYGSQIIMCPICDLDRINAIHRTHASSFGPGSTAEFNRLSAIKWRQTHPRLAPKKKHRAS